MSAVRQRGVTLIELLIVLVILSISLTLAAPSFVDMIKNNRLTSESYSLRSALTNARSEALSRRMRVIVCESTNGTSCASDTSSWSQGYLAFADADNDGAAAADEIIVSRLLESPGVTISFDNPAGTAQSSLSFSPRGDALGFTGTAVLCDDRGDEFARAIILNGSGQVRSATDTNDSGVVDTVDDSGTVVDVGC